MAARKKRTKAPAKPAKLGRPKEVVPEPQATQICELVSNGWTLSRACRKLGLKRPTVVGWTQKDPAFLDRYTRARLSLIEVWADDLIDVPLRVKDVQRAKLMVDSRKWLLAKLQPKVYGDRVTVGEGAETPMGVLSDAQVAHEIEMILDMAAKRRAEAEDG